MVYAVFSVEKEKSGRISEVLRDDIVSRQSIVIREAVVFGIEKNISYVLIEGSEEGIRRAKELFKDIGNIEEEKEAEKIYNYIKSTESSAEIGLGTVFEM
ncbi:MAG: hypothetical protein AB1779_10190 [Candidatus Thermoplasmatota archaeon]